MVRKRFLVICIRHFRKGKEACWKAWVAFINSEPHCPENHPCVDVTTRVVKEKQGSVSRRSLRDNHRQPG